MFFPKKQLLIYIILVLTTLLFSCIQISSVIPNKNIMSIKVETLLTVEWGNGNRQIPLTLVDPLPTSILSPFPINKVRRQVKISVSPSGEISLLSYRENTSSAALALVDSFSSTGEYIGRVNLNLETIGNFTWQIQDFVAVQDGSIYSLEFWQGNNKAEDSYRVKYTHIGSNNVQLIYQDSLDAKTPPQLLIDGNLKPFLVWAIGDKLQIRELTPQGIGSIYAAWGVPGAKLFMNAQGYLFQTQIQWQTDPPHRDWVSYDPSTQIVSHIVGKDEIYGLLGSPIGVDAEGQAYLQGNWVVSQLLKDGELGWTEEISNIITSSTDGKVFISTYSSEKDELVTSSIVHLRIFSKDGDYIESKDIEILTSSEDGNGGWDLIHVSDNGNLYIFGGADSLHQGKLLIYSPEGKLIKTQSPPPDLLPIQSSLQLTWSLDSQGRIYLPVLEPNGVRVMCMSRE
jgi:hypothetical protein